MTVSRQQKFRVVLVVFLILVAVGINIAATRWGSALGDDSYSYIKPARDLIAGQPVSFNAYFPPLLPIILSIISLAGIEPLDAIRVLNAILFGVSIGLTVLITYQLSKSFVPSFLAAVAVTLSAGLIEIYTWAMSEPLFITLSLMAFFSLINYGQNRKKSWLLAASISIGLAAFTRYIGIALIGTAGLYLCFIESPWKIGVSEWVKSRGKDLITFLPISVIPLAGYMIFNLVQFGRMVGHESFSWRLLLDTPWQSLWINILNWIIPTQIIGNRSNLILAILFISLLAFILLLLVFNRRIFRDGIEDIRQNPTPLLLILYIVIYILFLVFARGVLGGVDAFYERFLYPIQIVSLILAFSAIGFLFQHSKPVVKFSLTVGVVGVFVLLGIRAIYTIQFLNREGLGYASRRWHISETIAYLNHRPEIPVMSTGAPGIYFWTGRRPAAMADSQGEVRQFLCETEGFLVIIDALPLELYGASPDVTDGLIIEQDFSEGTIYRIDPTLCN